MNKLFVTRRENGGGRVRLLIGVGVGAGSDSGSAWSGSGDAVIVRSGTDARGPGEGTMAGRGESARSGPVGCERPYACQEGDAPTASRPALRDRLHPHPNVRATCACRARVAVVDAYICTALGARHGRRAPHAKCAKQRQVPSEGSRPVSAGGLQDEILSPVSGWLRVVRSLSSRDVVRTRHTCLLLRNIQSSGYGLTSILQLYGLTTGVLMPDAQTNPLQQLTRLVLDVKLEA
jgi:hypothetical protein